MVRNGKPKSTLLLYSFSLSIMLVVLYGGAFSLLLKPLEEIFAVRLAFGTFAVNLIESIFSSIAATFICILLSLVIRDKRIMPSAFLFIAFFAVLLVLYLLIIAWEDAALIVSMFFWFVLIPLAVGSSAVFFISFRQMKRKKE
jgi:hypothetical protein